MINKLFKKTSPEDLLKELKSSSFKENKANSILEHVNINGLDQNRQNFLHLMILDNKIESVKWLIKNGINFNGIDSKGNTPLMLACKTGFYDALDELLNVKADVNIENYKSYTAIEFAIYNNNFHAYKKLKPLIEDINRKNRKNETLLHVAIKAKNSEIIDDLFYDEDFIVDENILSFKPTFEDENILNMVLGKFKNYNKVDNNGKNILFYIVEKGNKYYDLFKKLVDIKVDINCIDKDGNNILLHLVEIIIYKKNHLVIDTQEDMNRYKDDIDELLDIIPHIIEKGINTEVINKKGENILSLATKNQHLKLLKLLLDCDVDINMLDKKDRNSLGLVVTKGLDYLETIYLLIDYGADVNMKDKDNKSIVEKVIDAAMIVRGQKKAKISEKQELNYKTDYLSILVSILVNTDVKLTQLNSRGEPYIFDALRHGAIDIIKLLIKHGADINEPDSEGNNIIYTYMKENQSFKKESELKEYYNNFQAIINMGANVNAKDSFGGVTLHKAILDCDITVIKMLLHSGADMNAIDNKGRHILHNAVWNNNMKVFKLVYTYNKSLLNEPDKFGVLPINYAAFLGYTDMVLDFLELNAQVNNPYHKKKYILNFLKKFHKNLKPLIEKARTKVQKEKLNILVQNMKKEFDVKED